MHQEEKEKADSQPSLYLYALFVICILAGLVYGNTQFDHLPVWKSSLGGLMFGAFLGLCAVNYSRLNF